MHNTIFFQPEENSLGFVCVFDFVSLVFIRCADLFPSNFHFFFYLLVSFRYQKLHGQIWGSYKQTKSFISALNILRH